MFHHRKLLILFTLFCVGLTPMTASAVVPERVHYQGQLTDGAGAAIHCPDPVNDCPSTPVNITFRIYDAAEDGAFLWEESHTGIPVNHGVFHVVLGNTTAITPDILNKELLFLSLNVNAKGQLYPRQRLVSAAYAVRAHYAHWTQDSAQLGGVDASQYATLDALDGICISPAEVDEKIAAGNFLTEEALNGYLTSNAYLKVELDPAFTASPAAGITHDHTSAWNIAYDWGDHAAAGYLSLEEDPKIGTLTQDNWCLADNGKVVCNQAAPPDTDTLADIACSTDELPIWDGAAWACVDRGALGTQRTDEEVATIVGDAIAPFLFHETFGVGIADLNFTVENKRWYFQKVHAPPWSYERPFNTVSIHIRDNDTDGASPMEGEVAIFDAGAGKGHTPLNRLAAGGFTTSEHDTVIDVPLDQDVNISSTERFFHVGLVIDTKNKSITMPAVAVSTAHSFSQKNRYLMADYNLSWRFSHHNNIADLSTVYYKIDDFERSFYFRFWYKPPAQ